MRRWSARWRIPAIAVVGASERPGSVGAAVVANLRASFDGPLHLVGEGLRGAFEPASHIVDERRIEAIFLGLGFLVLLGSQPDPRVER